MKVSIDDKRTYLTIAELVEGEAFIHRTKYCGDCIYIFVTYQQHNDVVVLLEVSENGMIPRLCHARDTNVWAIEPLEITGISFAPSTVRDHL